MAASTERVSVTTEEGATISLSVQAKCGEEGCYNCQNNQCFKSLSLHSLQIGQKSRFVALMNDASLLRLHVKGAAACKEVISVIGIGGTSGMERSEKLVDTPVSRDEIFENAISDQDLSSCGGRIYAEIYSIQVEAPTPDKDSGSDWKKKFPSLKQQRRLQRGNDRPRSTRSESRRLLARLEIVATSVDGLIRYAARQQQHNIITQLQHAGVKLPAPQELHRLGLSYTTMEKAGIELTGDLMMYREEEKKTRSVLDYDHSKDHEDHLHHMGDERLYVGASGAGTPHHHNLHHQEEKKEEDLDHFLMQIAAAVSGDGHRLSKAVLQQTDDDSIGPLSPTLSNEHEDQESDLVECQLVCGRNIEGWTIKSDIEALEKKVYGPSYRHPIGFEPRLAAMERDLGIKDGARTLVSRAQRLDNSLVQIGRSMVHLRNELYGEHAHHSNPKVPPPGCGLRVLLEHVEQEVEVDDITAKNLIERMQNVMHRSGITVCDEKGRL